MRNGGGGFLSEAKKDGGGMSANIAQAAAPSTASAVPLPARRCAGEEPDCLRGSSPVSECETGEVSIERSESDGGGKCAGVASAQDCASSTGVCRITFTSSIA